jgi:hypothetical protein
MGPEGIHFVVEYICCFINLVLINIPSVVFDAFVSSELRVYSRAYIYITIYIWPAEDPNQFKGTFLTLHFLKFQFAQPN